MRLDDEEIETFIKMSAAIAEQIKELKALHERLDEAEAASLTLSLIVRPKRPPSYRKRAH